MLISKEKFIEYLSVYKNAFIERDKFDAALTPFFESSLISTYQSELLRQYEEILIDLCECWDEDDIFSWWLYENVEKVITIKDVNTGEKVVYNVETIEGLYDYIYSRYHTNK